MVDDHALHVQQQLMRILLASFLEAWQVVDAPHEVGSVRSGKQRQLSQ